MQFKAFFKSTIGMKPQSEPGGKAILKTADDMGDMANSVRNSFGGSKPPPPPTPEAPEPSLAEKITSGLNTLKGG